MVDGACSVYEHRPTACRGMASHDVTSCEQRVGDIPTPPAYGLLRGLTDFGFLAALRVSELPDDTYELNHALLVALEEPDAEQRWLGGEQLFSTVMKDGWTDAAGMSSEDYVNALAKAVRGNAADILEFRLP